MKNGTKELKSHWVKDPSCGIGLSWFVIKLNFFIFCSDFQTLCKTFHLYLSELVGMLVVFNGFSGAICSGDFGQYDCKCYKCY